MKKAIRENILTAYSLHDMNIISVDIVGNDIILRTQSGLVETVFPYGQPDGYVEFSKCPVGLQFCLFAWCYRKCWYIYRRKKCF